MSNNYSVKRFRHAISLDERRVKFRPILWNEETSESERSLDVDFPDVCIKFGDSNVDVKEVWFAGDLTSTHNLSSITHNGLREYNFQVPMQMLGEVAALQGAIRVCRSYHYAG